MAVISGLNNSAIRRLKWTIAKLPKSAKRTLQDLETLMNMEGSYKQYREAIAQVVPPCIPYIGVLLMDLTFIEDGNRDKEGPLINFNKYRLIYKVLSSVLIFQTVAYSGVTLSPDIQRLISNAPLLADTQLYEASLRCEPRNATRTELL